MIGKYELKLKNIENSLLIELFDESTPEEFTTSLKYEELKDLHRDLPSYFDDITELKEYFLSNPENLSIKTNGVINCELQIKISKDKVKRISFQIPTSKRKYEKDDLMNFKVYKL